MCGLANHVAVKCRKKSLKIIRIYPVEAEDTSTEDEFTIMIDVVTHKIGSLNTNNGSSGEVSRQFFATIIVNDKAEVKTVLAGLRSNLQPPATK